jgi:hypothetical protein
MVSIVSTNPHAVRNIIGATFLLIAISWVYFFSGIGENTMAQCQVDAEGSGFCNFTNSGWTPGSICINVSLTGSEGVVASSGLVCSGRIWPDDTNRRDISIVVPNGHCIGLVGSEVGNICQMNISTSGETIEPTSQKSAEAHDEKAESSNHSLADSPENGTASNKLSSTEEPAADIQTIDGSNGIQYEIKDDPTGKLLESPNSTIILGTSCIVSSPQHGDGKWGWENDSVLIDFGNETISFPHQDPPFDDPRCPMD